MPKSWLEALSKTQRAVFPHVRRGVASGLSISRIGSAARKGGLSISNSVLSQMVRRERSVQDYAQGVSRMPRNQIPNPKFIPEALTRLQRAYSIEVQMHGTNVETGAKYRTRVTISADKPLTRGQIETRLESMMLSSKEKYGFEMEGFNVTAYMKAGAQGFEN